MELVIILIIITFFIGSISLALPTKSAKKISKLRIEASKIGCRVVSLSHSRIKFKKNDPTLICYQIKNTTNLKDAHFIRDKSLLILYSPVKLKYSNEYENINKSVQFFPDSIKEIIYSHSTISFLWKEFLGLDELKKIVNEIKLI